jgi:hypothetical protein
MQPNQKVKYYVLISFDSMTLELPLNRGSINPEKFYSCNETQTAFRLKEAYQRNGFTRMQVIEEGLFQVEVSSKVLGGRCLNLITKDTLPAVYRRLMEVGAFTCEWQVFTQALVLKCDVTQDVHCTQVNELIQVLQCYASKDYRVTDPYRNRHGNKTEIEFHRNRRDRKNQLKVTLYDKEEEVRKDRRFRSCLNRNEEEILLRQAQNLLRVEARFTCFAQMRKHFGVPVNTLENLLASPINVLHSIMQEITSKAPNASYSASNAVLNPSQLTPKEYPIYCTLELHDWNLGGIRATLKARDPKNLSRLMQPYEALYSRRNACQPHGLVTGIVNALRG